MSSLRNDSNLRYQGASSLARSQPYISKWEERGTRQPDPVARPLYASNVKATNAERPHGAIGSRRQGGATMVPPPHQFGQTTVHNVALIPNYFSSGEEEN